MTQGLADALRKQRHEVELIRFPFKFHPPCEIVSIMDFCEKYDVREFNGYEVDCVISLQFPAYYVQHPKKTLWLMHQHRAVYELYDHHTKDEEFKELKEKISSTDDRALKKFKSLYSISQNVSNRLNNNNNLSSVPIYHPPANENRYICEEYENYIFFPSRMESLKRQDLLIRAMQYIKSPITAIFAGEGGQIKYYQDLAAELSVQSKVRFLGKISEREKINFYANCLAVYFGPYDEDYGYVTLEAMLASKPVITCSDSGGPLEFVLHNETGFINEPAPVAIAQAIDFLYEKKPKARELGNNGRDHYMSMNISWHNVVNTLLSSY